MIIIRHQFSPVSLLRPPSLPRSVLPGAIFKLVSAQRLSISGWLTDHLGTSCSNGMATNSSAVISSEHIMGIFKCICMYIYIYVQMHICKNAYTYKLNICI